MSLTDAIDTYDLPADALAGKRMPVDAYLHLYKRLTTIRSKTGDYQRNSQNEPISHLIGIFDLTTTLLKHDIEPLFVFEGGYPEIKAKTLSQRGERRDNAREKYADAKDRGDTEAMKKWGPRTTSITDEMVEECKMVLDGLGVPYMHAETEADPQCAYLAQQEQFDYVLTADSDVLVYGAPAMLRKFDGTVGTLYPLESVLDNTGMSRTELIQAQILKGSDYNDGAHGVGWVYSKRYVLNSETFEDAMDKAAEKDDSIDRSRMREAYQWYQNPEIKRVDPTRFEWGEINPIQTTEYLVDGKELDDTHVRRTLHNVIDT